MFSPLSAVRRFATHLLPRLLIPALIGAYVFYSVDRDQRYLRERNLRLLAVMSDQFRSFVEGTDFSIREAAQSGRKVEEIVQHVKKVKNPSDLIHLETRGDWLYFRPVPEEEEVYQTSLPAILERAIRPGIFQTVLLADRSGDVLYQHAAGSLRFTDLGFLQERSSPHEKASPKKSAPADESASDKEKRQEEAADASKIPVEPHAIRYRSVLIGEEEYGVFTQPLVLETEGGLRQWMLIGIAKPQMIWRPDMFVRRSAVALCLLVALVILSWPLQRLWFLRPSEPLRRMDVIRFAACTVGAGTVLLSLVLYHYIDELAYIRTETRLQDLRRTISRNFRRELAMMLEQMEEWSRRARQDDKLNRLFAEPLYVNLERRHTDRWGILEDLPESRRHLFAMDISWVDATGMQRARWSTGKAAGPYGRRDDRAYFRDVMANRLVSLPGRPDVRFAIDQVRSRTHGETVTVLARPMSVCADCHVGASPRLEGPYRWVVTLGFRPSSLLDVVLPPDFGYAIVNRGGEVLFHSDQGRIFSEQLLEECDNSLLGSLVARGAQTFLSTAYHGRPHRLYVAPIEGLEAQPWVLVVYRDLSGIRMTRTQILITALVLFLFYVTLLTLAALLWWLVSGRRAPSYWSTGMLQRRTTAYLYLAAMFAILTAAGWVQTFEPTGHEEVLYATVFTSLAAVALAGYRLNHREHGRTNSPARYQFIISAAVGTLCWLRAGWVAGLLGASAMLGIGYLLAAPRVFRALRGWRRHSDVSYVTCSVSLYVLIAGIPCLTSFRLAYRYEMEVFVRSGQLRLMEALERRSQLLEEGAPRVPGVTVDAIERRISFSRRHYDVYGDAFFESTIHDRVEPHPCEPAAAPPNWWRRAYWHLVSTPELDRSAVGRDGRLRRLQEVSGAVWCHRWPGYERFLVLHKAGYRFQPPTVLQITSVVPAFDPPRDLTRFAAWSFWIPVVFVLASLSVWIRKMANRLFLLKLATPPRLPVFPDADEKIMKNLLVLGWPGSGKSDQLRSRPEVVVVDLQSFDMSPWPPEAIPAGKIVAIDHLESCLESTVERLAALRLLERLVLAEKRVTILVSTVDPVHYLSAGGSERWIASQSEMDRWTRLMNCYSKVRAPDSGHPRFYEAVEKFRRALGDHRERDKLAGVLRLECSASRQLQTIAVEFADSLPASYFTDKPQLLEDIRSHASAYYAMLWDSCSQAEKLALIQFIRHGMVNPKASGAVQALLARRLLRREPHLRVFNESFRLFVPDAEPEDRIAEWEKEGIPEGAGLNLAYAAIGVALVLFFTQKEMTMALLAFITMVLGGIANVSRYLRGDVTGRASQENE